MNRWFSKINSFVLKQYNVAGMWFGAMQSQFNNVWFYVGMVQFLLVAVMAYHTTLRDTILKYIPWMSFWIFLLVGVILFFLAMLVDYKIVVPSRINYSNYQAYKHYNPVKDDLRLIQADIQKIMVRLEKIESTITKSQRKNEVDS